MINQGKGLGDRVTKTLQKIVSAPDIFNSLNGVYKQKGSLIVDKPFFTDEARENFLKHADRPGYVSFVPDEPFHIEKKLRKRTELIHKLIKRLKNGA